MCYRLFFIALLGQTLSGQTIIIIDPGHGGKFSGCSSANNRLTEKDVALDVAQRIAHQLTTMGMRTILTRTTDKELQPDLMKDLQQRRGLIDKEKADLFISIHLNGTKDATTRGFEIYVPYAATFDAKSYELAAYIHHQMSQHFDAKWVGNLGNLNVWDRGIRAAAFNVLRSLPCPGVLIELDYLTNPTVEQQYQSPAYRQKVAQIITQAIASYQKSIYANIVR